MLLERLIKIFRQTFRPVDQSATCVIARFVGESSRYRCYCTLRLLRGVLLRFYALLTVCE